jgi:hypothetical protein
MVIHAAWLVQYAQRFAAGLPLVIAGARPPINSV